MMNDPAAVMEALILAVHRRNGGKLQTLDFQWPLTDARLGLDSLDLAEIMAELEKTFGVSPFEGENAPKTWQDILHMISHE